VRNRVDVTWGFGTHFRLWFDGLGRARGSPLLFGDEGESHRARFQGLESPKKNARQSETQMPDGLSLSHRADAWQARPIDGRWLREATAQLVPIGTSSTPVDAPRAQRKTPREFAALAGSIRCCHCRGCFSWLPDSWLSLSATRRAGAPQVKTQNDATGRPAA
jgi:hypothetical protein